MSEPLPAFVARRRPDWTALEGLLDRLARRALGLDELTTLDALYRRTSADLAQAQRRYAGTDVVRFLNQLCARAYAAIYRPRGDRVAALRQFYAHTFPALARQLLRPTGVAAGLLVFGAVLGALVVALHPEGTRLLVPVHLRAFIDRRELWTDAALSVQAPSELAAAIFTNNLRVMIGAFALGITAGLGTVIVVVYNGLHLGAVLAACFAGGVGPNILAFLAAHGPVELSIICLAGGAGLHTGQALLDPGEGSRAAALRVNAREAVQVVLGCAPFLVAIGIVEGFVSPGSFFPWPLKVLTGAVTGVAFWRWILRG